MTKATAQPIENLPKCSARITIPNKAKNKPDFSFSHLDMDDEVTLVCKGKVRSLRKDEYEKSLEIEPTSVSISGKKSSTLIDAIEKSKRGEK